MKRLFFGAILGLATVGALHAQSMAPSGIEVTTSATPDFATTSAARVNLITPANSSAPLFVPDAALSATADPVPAPLATALAVPLAGADPAIPEPKPKFLYGGRDDYRWQLGLGVAWERFRSSIFNASEIGVNSSVAYFTNDWFGIEGGVSAMFAPSIYDNDPVRIVNYVVGPKIAWRQRRWEPWAHVMVGGSHEQPQTVASGRNGFAIQAGGGADFRWNPRLSFRLDADYLRNNFFKESQNNFLLGGGIVFHF
jgi:hypothetical protein